MIDRLPVACALAVPLQLSLPLLVAASAVALAPLAHSDVLQVGPGAPYATIHDALADTLDGDIVLVAPGTYGFFGMFGKGVTVVADGGTVNVTGAVRIQGLPAGGTATLSGLTIRGDHDPGLIVYACDGAVRVEDCLVFGGYTQQTSGQVVGLEGARVYGSLDVAFVGGRFSSPQPCWHNPVWDEWYCNQGDAGVEVTFSTVTFDGTFVRGGTGFGNDQLNFYGAGFPGVEARSSIVTLRGAEIRGGFGGSTPGSGWWGGDGGPGLDLDAATKLYRLDSIVEGGDSFSQLGPPITGSGTVVDWPGLAPRSTAPPVVREGQPAMFTFTFEPATRVDLLVSLACGRTWLPAFHGDLLVTGPFLRGRYIAGTTDASGQLTWAWTPPNLPAMTGLTLRWQSAHVDADGGITLGRMHSLVTLDGAF